MSPYLKPVRFDAGRGINIIAIADGYRQPPAATLEAYDEHGRRYLIRFDEERLNALSQQIECTKRALATDMFR